jgi:hypothetical protein
MGQKDDMILVWHCSGLMSLVVHCEYQNIRHFIEKETFDDEDYEALLHIFRSGYVVNYASGRGDQRERAEKLGQILDIYYCTEHGSRTFNYERAARFSTSNEVTS